MTTSLAIAVGTIIRLVRQEGETFSFGDSPGAPRAVTFPFAYYEVELEEVIRPDRDLGAGSTVVIRVAGSAELDGGMDGRVLMPQAGDRRLLILRRHFDGVSYGVDTFHILNLTGEVVTFGDRDRTPINYLSEQSAPAAFLGQLRALYGE